MKKPCDKCCCTGFTIGWSGQEIHTTAGRISGGAVSIPCKKCDATGWFDEDSEISVPIKYVKDEYFEI
jgi:hypothetical protein